jgi:FkbM family methyltransferase
VVAVEPQAALVRTLRLLYERDPGVSIESAVVGARSGEAVFFLNLSNPTVSTASTEFILAAKTAAGWEGQVWERQIRLPQTTLDALIERHGLPTFMKIDVEGFEAEALAGLSFAVPAFSFEFTTIQRSIARDCLAACERLGTYGYRACLGESQRFVQDRWLSAEEIGTWIDELPHEANSGDIYAALVGQASAGCSRRAG